MTHGHSGVHPFQQLWLEIFFFCKSFMLYSLKPHHHNHHLKKMITVSNSTWGRSADNLAPSQDHRSWSSHLSWFWLFFVFFCAFFAIKKATIPWHRSFQSAWCNHWGCKGGSQSSNLLKILLQNLCFRDLKFCLIIHFCFKYFTVLFTCGHTTLVCGAETVNILMFEYLEEKNIYLFLIFRQNIYLFKYLDKIFVKNYPHW